MTQNSTSKKISKTNILHLLFLLTAGGFLIWMLIPEGSWFGSATDWFSQHVTIADYMRKHFYATGEFFPDFSGLGGGSNFYVLSYYGFLRPDIMLSYFLPKVPMAAIIQGYAIFEVLLGAVLLYLWLHRKGFGDFSCLVCGSFYLLANCMFQAHRQIMFVNYLPFMILALMCLDSMTASTDILKERLRPHMGLIFSLLMILLHSFYFFPSCFVACSLYLWFQSSRFKDACPAGEWKKLRKNLWVRYVLNTAASVCLAMALLLPTGLAILENHKDVAGTSLFKILTVNPSMDSLLYSPYGCGLGIFCLYAIFLCIREKKTRKPALLLFFFLSWDFLYWLLNATLYVRPKSLIPFLPLILYLTAWALEGLQKGEIRHSLPLALLSAVPGAVQILFCSVSQEKARLIQMDAAVLMGGVLLWHAAQKAQSSGKIHTGRLSPHLPKAGSRARSLASQTAAFLLLCTAPALLFLETGTAREEYVQVSDASRDTFSQEEILSLCKDSQARLDVLEHPSSNSNYAVSGTQNKSTLYSSVSNSNYNHVFFDILKMPVSIRNRVAMTADANPFQEYLMGVRYIQTSEEKIPAGYQILQKREGHVLAENKNVLPLAYGSTALMDEEAFDSLAYPKNLDTLMNRTIVPGTKPREDAAAGAQESTATDASDSTTASALGSTSANAFLPYESQMEEYALPEDFFARESTKKDTTAVRKLPQALAPDTILLLSFDVDYSGAQDISITINSIRNRLSGSKAPYPNQNTTFTYMISSPEALTELNLCFSKGNYKISKATTYTLPLSALDHPGLAEFQARETTGRQILNGSITMEEDGYFATSFAFSHGYIAYVDGEKVTPVQINKAFVGFPLQKGTHEITLEFHAPGKTLGLFVSLLTAGGLLLENLLYALACHKKRVLRRVRVISFADPVSCESKPLIKADGSSIAHSHLQVDGSDSLPGGKTD